LPHVENGRVDGIQARFEGGLVRVEADAQDGVCSWGVSNPYEERGEQHPSRGTRQALSNIEARLAGLFGPRASRSVERRDGRHYSCLRYPCARLTQEARAI